MRLTKDQIQQAVKKYKTPSGYYNIPTMGLMTKEQIADGVNNDVIRFHFENGRLYVTVVAEERRVDTGDGKTKQKVDHSNADEYFDKHWPKADRTQASAKQGQHEQHEFALWLRENVEPTNEQQENIKKYEQMKEKHGLN